MDRAELVEFLRKSAYAVEATSGPAGAPQAAVVGVVVSDALEIFFDTSTSSRKHANLSRDPRVALVCWIGERTVQIEGVADFPRGDDLDRLKKLYFARFPDGTERERWPDIAYVRVTPTWVRSSDFGASTPKIEEARADALA